MVATQLKPGDVLRYTPQRGFMPWHCRDGYAVFREDTGGAYDTYWNDGGRPSQDCHRVTDAELAEAGVVFNLDDYDELDRYDRGSKLKWETYSPDDRQRIPCHSGYHTRFFIRKGAKPSLETQIENARREVEEAESELRSAEWRVQCRREDLAKLEAQR